MDAVRPSPYTKKEKPAFRLSLDKVSRRLSLNCARDLYPRGPKLRNAGSVAPKRNKARRPCAARAPIKSLQVIAKDT